MTNPRAITSTPLRVLYRVYATASKKKRYGPLTLPERPYPDYLLTQLLEKCGLIRTAWKARQSRPNQQHVPPHLNAGPPNIPPALAQQQPLPPAYPQPSHPIPHPHSHSQIRDPQPQLQHSFSHAQMGVQGGPVQTQPQIGAGLQLLSGEIRYGPIQASRWSRVTGPEKWGGMFR